jgi:hypothetical protein
MTDDNDLLRPSLTGSSAPATAIYSARTGYVASFVGGPVAGAVIALMNAYRLRRLSRDWPVAVLAVALLYAMFWWEFQRGGHAWLESHVGPSGPRILFVLLSFMFFGGIYLLHRTNYRNMEIMGLQPPPGWVPGLVAVIVGWAAAAAFMFVLTP